MGRPLKIQKSSTGSGNGGAAVGVDLGFPNFGSLTAPVVNTANTLNTTEYLGVVGGAAPTDTPTTTNPRVDVIVNITGSAGVAQGYIIRQKGSHKYLVATTASIDPADAVVGVALRITAVGDTNWTAMGLSGTAAIGTIFTPTAAAGAGTSGTAQEVGVCVLTSDLTPTAGLMSISYFTGDSTEVAISKLTNKYLLNWSTFQNAAGDSLTTYADGGNNVGPVVYSGEGQYLSNFFTDEGTATKSGSEDNSTLALAIVENYTS